MADVKKFVLNDFQLSLLSGLREPLVVREPVKRIGGRSMLTLDAAGGSSVRLRVMDHSVAFKFEVFELFVEPRKEPPEFHFLEIRRIAQWDTLKCVFRFEWQRPATVGEVPSHYEKIVGDRGPKAKVPKKAISSAVSTVGIAFSKGRSPPKAAIMNSDDDPMTLCVLDDTAEIRSAIQDCEVVDLRDVPRWLADLQLP